MLPRHTCILRGNAFDSEDGDSFRDATSGSPRVCLQRVLSSTTGQDMEPSGCAAGISDATDKGAASASHSKAASIIAAAGSDGKESLAESIIRLKVEQQQGRESRKRLSRELHNAQRRASRLKKRARQLTDGDLVEVLKMREVKAPICQPSVDEAVVQKPIKECE